MERSTGGERVAGYRVDRILEAVERFRGNWRRYHRPDDVNHLLRQFRKVDLQRGYVLDYIALGSSESGWIWPFARRDTPGTNAELPSVLREIPSDRLASEGRAGSLHSVAVQSLYRYLSFERSPQGLFEYAYFINELWATKSPGRESDWLSLVPLLVRHKFDAVLRREADRLVRVSKPDHYDPLVFVEGAGGRVQFLAYQSGPWKRIIRLALKVEDDGSVGWQPLDVVASLSR
ncbi:MAG: hypothetical protein WBR18_12205 [Anaerolineales bacterium]